MGLSPIPLPDEVPVPRAALPGRGSAPGRIRLAAGDAGALLICWSGRRLPGRGIGFSSLRCSISLKRDSCDCFQMCASSPPAGWGGCGKLHDGNQNPDQMYRVSLGNAHIWPQCAGTAGADGWSCFFIDGVGVQRGRADLAALLVGSSIPWVPARSAPGADGERSGGAVQPASRCPGFAKGSLMPWRAGPRAARWARVWSSPAQPRCCTRDVGKDL